MATSPVPRVPVPLTVSAVPMDDDPSVGLVIETEGAVASTVKARGPTERVLPAWSPWVTVTV